MASPKLEATGADNQGDAPAERFNILLVDDQPDGLLALEAILGPLGQNLVRASSGREALRLLLKYDYALILLDVVMPGMDGFETAALIRERDRTRYTPIIFLTAARKGEGPLNRGYETGAVDFIFKPIDAEVLKSKVRVFVDLAKKTQLVLQQQGELRQAQQREHERALSDALARVEAQRLRLEMEAREQQRLWLDALMDQLPAPLLLADPATGQITYASPSAAHLREAVETAPADSPFRAALRGESFQGALVEHEVRGESGAFLLFSRKLPAMHARGETVVICTSDVTALKQTEAQLQHAVKARDEFMSAASHELNTPLTTIVLQLDSLARHLKKVGLGEDPKASKVIGTLSRNVDRLGRLIAELLDVSRIAEGRLKLDLAEVDLTEIVRDVAQRFEEHLARVGCELTLSVDGPAIGTWDRSRLDQVVTNLLTNAMKYAPGKPVEMKVSMEGEVCRFVIKDNGIGIAKENHGRVFERFERAVPTENYAGLGLGLWIVSRIVGEMGGTISLQSGLGEGAVFTVELPRTSNLVRVEPTEEGQAAPPAPGGPIASPTPLSLLASVPKSSEVAS